MAKTTKKSIVVETTQSNHELPTANTSPSAASSFEDSNTAPIVKSIGVVKLAGKNLFSSYVIYTQGTEVIKVELDEPNLRAIAEDAAKINFVNLFMNSDVQED